MSETKVAALVERAIASAAYEEPPYCNRAGTQKIEKQHAEITSLRSRIAELEARLETKFTADMDAEIVVMVRECARQIFHGNCSFADDDLRLMAACAKWALLNGIPDEINPEIIRKAKAHQTAPESQGEIEPS